MRTSSVGEIGEEAGWQRKMRHRPGGMPYWALASLLTGRCLGLRLVRIFRSAAVGIPRPGDFSGAKLIRKLGDVPEDLSAL